MPEDLITAILLYRPQEIAKFVGGIYVAFLAACLILILWSDDSRRPK